jgi:hypothetical protein
VWGGGGYATAGCIEHVIAQQKMFENLSTLRKCDVRDIYVEGYEVVVAAHKNALMRRVEDLVVDHRVAHACYLDTRVVAPLHLCKRVDRAVGDGVTSGLESRTITATDGDGG